MTIYFRFLKSKRLSRNRVFQRSTQIHSSVATIARHQTEQLQQSFKTPWATVSIYQKIFARFWYPFPVEFSSDHYLVYNDPQENPKVLFWQRFEIIWSLIYGIIMPFYMFYRKIYCSDHPLYKHLTWIHISLCLVNSSATIAITFFNWMLHSNGVELVPTFNALLNLKQSLHSGNHANHSIKILF